MLRHLEEFQDSTVDLPRGQHLYRQHDSHPHLHVVLNGWLGASKTVGNGSRQILKVFLPGDLIGLPDIDLSNATEAVHAFSNAKLRLINKVTFRRAFGERPHLAWDLFLLAQLETRRLNDLVTKIGRTTPIERVAALIAHLQARHSVGDTLVTRIDHVPLAQADIGDMLALTGVHVNRVVRALREAHIARWHRQTIEIIDQVGLERLSEGCSLPPRRREPLTGSDPSELMPA